MKKDRDTVKVVKEINLHAQLILLMNLMLLLTCGTFFMNYLKTHLL